MKGVYGLEGNILEDIFDESCAAYLDKIDLLTIQRAFNLCKRP